ncbi:MAG: NAD-dependent epimerase/dehydratase family protein [Actinomycetota bacterium]
MRALVTGGAGFIGSHLSQRLAQAGREVLVVDNLASGTGRLGHLEASGIPVLRLDIRSPEFSRAVSEFRPDEIFHLAAQMDVRRSVADPIFDADVNILGTLRLLEAARECGARVVSTSSGGCIYGEPDLSQLPIDETATGRPSSPYGISKKVTEDYLVFYRNTYGLPFVNLALANVYGPRQDPHGEAGVVAIFGRRLLAGESCAIFGDGKQTRDFVFVSDVVDAFMAAAGAGEGETFNIGTGIQTSVVDLYSEMARLCGSDAEPEFRPARTGELENSALDSSKAGALLGWKPATDLTSGLQATIDWFREA